jgi:methylenetetrahydrofolate--tRNA-(uracil-5-)-methyltransferase
LLEPTLELRGEPGLYFAGQITGTEGYVESAAGGWLAAFVIAERLAGREPRLPPKTTAHGALLTHLSRSADTYQPSNITFSHFPPLEGTRLKKRARYEKIAERALADLGVWAEEVGVRAVLATG